jgi:hypothetical protein
MRKKYQHVVPREIFKVDEIVDGYCETLNKDIRRANSILVKDDNGFIYEISDACLTQPTDEQVRAVCSNCEYFWMRKLIDREYLLVAKTKDHFQKFKNKQIDYTKKISKVFNERLIESGRANAKAYFEVTDYYMRDLSLLDGRAIVTLTDSAAIMFGMLKRIEGDNYEVMLIADMDKKEPFFSGEIVSKKEKDSIREIEGENPANFFVSATNSIEEVLSENLATI